MADKDGTKKKKTKKGKKSGTLVRGNARLALPVICACRPQLRWHPRRRILSSLVAQKQVRCCLLSC